MKSPGNNRSGSFDWTIVKEALRRAIPAGEKPSGRASLSAKRRDVEISVLINDVFGGEIVRTHNRRGCHFYNRINGECIDLTLHEESGSTEDFASGDSSGSTAYTSGHTEQNDYTTFFQKFLSALEEAVGLGKYQPA